MSANKTGYQHPKQNAETESRKAECIRLHIEMNLGITAISNKLIMNKALVRKWLVKAGVYRVGGRTSKNFRMPTRWRRIELGSERKGWVDYETTIYKYYKRPFKNRLQHERIMADPKKRIKFYARKRVRRAFKDALKAKRISISNLFGCTATELCEHLASRFKPGMTLHNHGLWHIDHIRPLASFDLTDDAQVRQACHYTNLQPLWAGENISKGDKWLGSSGDKI